ncbi:type II secretion system F family protein [Solidesulfovibrio sp.]|uniref:type II secretion system F family protein n=1 Tax=Solidesulfovibrio sp. TaxID=2910990 RepID=UPI002B21B73B|nr:type II secretion system F family protein [Solidesulfovibrio sp.]MEA4858699.1 type II secretion system F family protein [Solidesulfovibrio sp.]
MPVFEYTAVDAKGRARQGILTAESAQAARQLLRAKRLYVSAMTEARGGGPATPAAGARHAPLFSRRVSRAQLLTATQVLATLLEAGLPLDKALTSLIDQMRPGRAKWVFSHILERIREGQDFTSALAAYPGVFPPTYISMVRSAEATGMLPIVLANLAEYMDRQLALARTLQAALAYPAFMFFFGILVLGLLLTYVIPEVTRIFVDLKRSLPLPTVILIAVSDFFRTWWPAILGGCVGLGFLTLRLSRTARGRAVKDRLALSLPVIGPIARHAATARLCRTLGTCLLQGVTMLAALRIAGSVSGNVAFEQAMERIRDEASQGGGLTDPMREADIFPPIVIQLVSAGEQSGRLGELLVTLARMLEADVGTRIKAASALFEPVMILLLGGMVGLMVLAVLLPIFEMSSLIG